MGTQDVQTQDEFNTDLSYDYPSPQRVLLQGQLCQCHLQDGTFLLMTSAGHRAGSALLGSPVLMSGLVIVMHALVSVVTRHDVLPIWPSAFTVSLPLLVNTQ
jgi:hypothetical protein